MKVDPSLIRTKLESFCGFTSNEVDSLTQIICMTGKPFFTRMFSSLGDFVAGR